MKQLELFFWGILAALGALFTQMLLFLLWTLYSNPVSLSDFDFSNIGLGTIALFALVEEAFKYLIIRKRVDRISLERSFVLNALIFGAGFAFLEISMTIYQQGLPDTIWFNLLALAVVHMSSAAVMGYLLALHNPHKFSTFFKTVFAAWLMHFAYNFLAFNKERLLFSEKITWALLAFFILSTLWNILRLPQKLAS